MKKLLLLLASCLCATLSAQASSTSVTVKPSDATLSGLDHYYAYSWGFNLDDLKLGNGWKLSSATIKIKGIWDWTDEKGDRLFIDLIDNAKSGVKSYSDTNADATHAASDFFTDGGYKKAANQAVTKLTWYTDPKGGYDGKYKIDYSYSFTAGQLDILAAYLASKPIKGQSTVGLGFDADCHYYNSGVSFTATSAYVPDAGSTMALLGLGLGALAFLRRRRA